MSGSVQDGGEGRVMAFERVERRIGMEKLRDTTAKLETMARIKNAARFRKINTALSLSLSFFRLCEISRGDVRRVERTREKE